MKKNLILVVSLILFFLSKINLNAQDINNKGNERKDSSKVYITLGLFDDLIWTDISNKNENNDPYIKKTKEFTPDLGINAYLFFNPKLAISLGVGHASYKDQIDWILPQTFYNYKGNTGSITFNGNLSKTEKFGFVEIPLTLLYDWEYNRMINFYLNPGLTFGFLSSVKETVTGSVNVTHNNNSNSVDTNITNVTNSTNGFNKFILFGNISYGFYIHLSKVAKFNLGLFYRTAITNLYASSNQEVYQQIDGTTKPYKSFKPKGMGFQAGLNFKL